MGNISADSTVSWLSGRATSSDTPASCTDHVQCSVGVKDRNGSSAVAGRTLAAVAGATTTIGSVCNERWTGC